MNNKGVILCIIIFFFGVSCGDKASSRPTARNSILDLSRWNFERQGMVDCSGPWAFYWKRLLPSGAYGNKKIIPDFYIKVPGSWTGEKSFSGVFFDDFGYATFKLEVLLPSGGNSRTKYKIYTGYIGTSYRLILMTDGETSSKVLLQAGTVGTSPEKSGPLLKYGMAEFEASGRVSLFLQVSNFDDVSMSGPIGRMYLGTPSQIDAYNIKRRIRDFFMMGAILMIGLYHIVIFLIRRKEKPPLFFGLLCLLMTLRILLVGTYVEEFTAYDDIFQLNIRISYFTYFCGIMLVAVLLHSIFPGAFSKKGIRLVMIVTIIYSVVIIVLPVSVFSYLMKYYNIFAIVVMIWCVYGVFLEYVKTRETVSFIILLATTMLAMTALHDILSYSRVIRTPFVIHYGIAVFILLQSFVVAIINASSREKSERLAEDFAREKESLGLTEMQLQTARNYLHNVFSSLPSILFSVNGEENVTEWNLASEKFTGVNAGEAVLKSVWEVIPSLVSYKKQVKSVIRNNSPVILAKVSLNDDDRYYDIAMHPLSMSGSEGAVIRIDDITEKVLTEDKLQQAQKMDTIGNLVSGLSHDFNNILGAIIGTISLMKRLTVQNKMTPEIMEKYLLLLKESSDRARGVIQQLLSLSSRNKLALAPVDLNLSIKHVVKMCESSFDKSVIINASYYERSATILADPVQIEQMLLNLCLNSFQAMTIMRGRDESQGGELWISVEKNGAADSPEQKWCITVRDTGVGIEKDLQQNIFDPFFTTKSDSGGTGLGLAMAYAITRRHNGYIEADSEPGRGTAMRVYFPVVDSSMIYPQDIRLSEEIPTGRGRILVIDDEVLMRETAREMLMECGYDVITAENGMDGINIYRYIKDEIDLVLLNIIMPRMSGYETYMELRKIKDSVKVIITSGLRDDPRISMSIEAGARSFMPKPFSLSILAQEVDRVLGEDEHGPKAGSS